MYSLLILLLPSFHGAWGDSRSAVVAPGKKKGAAARKGPAARGFQMPGKSCSSDGKRFRSPCQMVKKDRKILKKPHSRRNITKSGPNGMKKRKNQEKCTKKRFFTQKYVTFLTKFAAEVLGEQPRKFRREPVSG
ncbi:hypothetical protein [Intestinibacillus sp. Marseille-P6563]|uniref:hypothetical protein n=1 Tax=Intestinibacillus sp. Marseille-P6563 TaxID=2364792 RepID=UPI0013DEF0F3|nr:hypothetical protein [Intestinibacillus sp. Marseille-P6563]